MKTNLDPYNWRQARLSNYSEKLQLTKRKAFKRLMIFTDIGALTREFDRICDSPYRSHNEPGISHEEKKRRFVQHKKPVPVLAKPIQLKLFSTKQFLITKPYKL